MRQSSLRRGILPAATLVWAFLALLTCSAQPQLALLPLDPATDYYNPDSVMIDTNAASPTFNTRFARKWFWVLFPDHIFSQPLPHADTAAALGWADISPTFSPIRLHFDTLAQKFGPYRLTKALNDSLLSGAPGSNAYYLAFDHYVNIDSVDAFLVTITGLRGAFLDRGGIVATLPSDRALTPMTEWPDIVYDNSQTANFWPAHFHPLGWHWNHYQQKSPMAWEITSGRPDILIAFNDNFDGPVSTHPDMENFVVIGSPYDGSAVSLPLRATSGIKGHGLGVSSCAIAAGNNDHPGALALGMIGSCPTCTGININALQAPAVDTDGDLNGILTPPDILTSSAGFSREEFGRSTWKTAIEAGIVVTAAAGNHRDDYKQSFGWSRHRIYTNPQGQKVALFYNCRLYPPAFAWADPADPTNGDRDVRVIAVGATTDGTLQECTHSFEGRRPPEVYMAGPEQFHPAFNFGPGTDKFSTLADPAARVAAKEFAYIDIVAPTGRIAARDGAPGTTDYREKFYPNHEGTSEATPSVAGVVGLMLSINPGMGATGADVQRRVYNALTFTADKIPDRQNFNSQERQASWISYVPKIDQATGDVVRDASGNPVMEKKSAANHMPDLMRFSSVNPTLTDPPADGEPIQYDYVEQSNDPLHRWWAQRVGFGRLNAYRAVAHAIPLKGNPVWNVSQTLFNGVPNPPTNPDGFRLMHFGAYNAQGEPVLEHGGEDLPGQNFNNQGRTRINGTGTELIVPENSILAIDGLLQTDNPTGNNTIRTAGNGRLLITGYLEDVSIKGNLRIDDLIVRGTTSCTNASLEIGDPDVMAEVYGSVRLLDYGTVRINKGRLLMQPGSRLTMEGENDLYMTDGATLELSHASAITGTAGRRIVVGAGCTITVKEDCHVDLLTEILIKSGGSMVIEPDAVVSLNRFTVERDGELIVREGARLRLNDRAENLVNGRLHVLGSAAKRAVISGRVQECCTRVCTHVIDRASIRVEDHITDPANRSACNLRLLYANVSNVPIRAINAPLYPILLCNFTADRSLFNDASQNLLLDLQLTDPDIINMPYNPPGGAPLRESARVIACTFSDEAGPVPLPRGAFHHTLSGLRLEHLKRAWVSACTFTYLHSSVESSGCDSLGVESSEFFTGDFGLVDEGSVLRLCTNTFREVEFGTLLVASRTSWIFANTFRQSRTGLLAFSGYTSHFLRDNTFQEFDHAGILLQKTGARLDAALLGRAMPLYSLWGRNTFHYSGAGTVFGPVVANADIRLRDPFAAATLSCGYNRFAERTTWHLYSDLPKTNYPVGFNSFPDPTAGHALRTFNVACVGAPINVSAALPGCTPVTGSYCTAPPLSSPYPGVDPFYLADGGWADLPWNDPYLADAFQHSRAEMLNPALPAPSRLVKLANAIESGTLGDSVKARLTTLINDYGAIATNPLNPPALRSAAWLLKGQAQEHLGWNTPAAYSFSQVTGSYPDDPDSLAAAWRGMAVAAINADTTRGLIYDSLMNARRLQVLEDLRRIAFFPAPAPKPLIPAQPGITDPNPIDTTDPSAQTILYGNTPNPFAKETTIRYHIPHTLHVRLSVTDPQGHEIALLVSDIRNPGDHEVPFSAATLPPGLYFCRLEVDGQQWIQGMQVQR